MYFAPAVSRQMLNYFCAKDIKMPIKRRIGLMTLSIGLLASLLASAPAHAQATRTWVSGVGDDVNPCSRTAPCKTFAGAISKTAAGGEIDCLDPGGFGTVTITKSITIDCTGTMGSILSSGTNGININDANAVVRLKSLSINGAGTTTGLTGINVLAANAVFVENVIIQNFNTSPALGIKFATPTGLLFVKDTVISHNGLVPSTGGGIQIANGSGGFSLTNVNLTNNVTGMALTGAAVGELKDSVIAGSFQNGILALAGTLVVNNSSIINNALAGVSSSGATVTLGSSTIVGNGTGVTGSTLLSYKNNQISGNSTNGTPITAVPGYTGTGQ
jgi:hypothetical protein